MDYDYDVLIVGGGAAGFFTALNAATLRPELRIGLIERGASFLTKVKVSGGGRCNVTHAEFDPSELVKNYPRGEKELLGPFHSFSTGDTVAWFEERGIALKIEEDGRMFPTTDSSQTIIDCFLQEANQLGISLLKKHSLQRLKRTGDSWLVETNIAKLVTKHVVIATGSNTKIWKLLETLGHHIVPAVPSLFTFNIGESWIHQMAGISTMATVEILDEDQQPLLESHGPLLLTHWGFSGPAILRLSAWGAQILNQVDYRFQIRVNWLDNVTATEALESLKEARNIYGRKKLVNQPAFQLPKRLWKTLIQVAQISEDYTYANLTKIELQEIANILTDMILQVDGKSTFKEEFVTAGGVSLKEVDFRTFESKLFPKLYFAGEVLDIDAITGGFNFQNAWTGGFVVAKAISRAYEVNNQV